MKINKVKVIQFLLGAVLLFLLVLAIYFDRNSPAPPPSHSRVRYLRDSLEMEYYKKAIKDSYPFDRSKISTDESNP